MRILLALLIILFAGCSKTGSPIPVSQRTLTNGEIDAWMWNNGFGKGFIADASYDLPQKSWLEWQCGKEILDSFLKLGFVYQKGRWDCDKFAHEAVAVVHRLHYANRSSENGIAFGEVWFKRFAGGWHAVNFVFLDVQGEIKIMFYEPQSFEPLRLSNAELQTVAFWKL
jgi:hypothetical protein